MLTQKTLMSIANTGPARGRKIQNEADSRLPQAAESEKAPSRKRLFTCHTPALPDDFFNIFELDGAAIFKGDAAR